MKGFRKGRESTKNSFQMRPIPRTEGALMAAKQAKQSLCQALTPATRGQIAVLIKKLSLHCGMQAKAASEVKMLLADYCIDLAGYPAYLIEEACGEIRRDPSNKFLPSSGALIQIMTPKMNKLKLIKRRVDKILGEEKDPQPKKQKGMISISSALDGCR